MCRVYILSIYIKYIRYSIDLSADGLYLIRANKSMYNIVLDSSDEYIAFLESMNFLFSLSSHLTMKNMYSATRYMHCEYSLCLVDVLLTQLLSLTRCMNSKDNILIIVV